MRQLIVFAALLFALGFALPSWANAATIQPGDTLRLTCPEEPQIEKDYRVTRDGFILVDFIGAVQVAGLTPEDAAARVSELLETNGILREATVGATVVATAGETPTNPPTTPGTLRVEGEVTTSGEFPWKEGLTLEEALALAVPTDSADLARVRILTQQEEISYDLEEAGDTPVPAGAVITVPKRLQAFVLGEVAQPGVYSWREGLTALDLIALAGGLTVDADGKAIKIEQPGLDSRAVDIEGGVNPTLSPGDNLVVPRIVILETVSLEGLVGSPGEIPYRPGMTLTEAVRAAGGVLPGAEFGRTTLTREGEKDRTLDLKSILQGLSGDILLQPGDRVNVPGVRPSRRRTNNALLLGGGAALIFILFGR